MIPQPRSHLRGCVGCCLVPRRAVLASAALLSSRCWPWCCGLSPATAAGHRLRSLGGAHPVRGRSLRRRPRSLRPAWCAARRVPCAAARCPCHKPLLHLCAMHHAAVATLHFTRLRRKGTRAAARGLAAAAADPPTAVRHRSSQGVDKEGILRYNVQYTAMVVPGQLIADNGPRGPSERLTLRATIAGMGRFFRPAYAWCGYRARAGRRVSPARWGRYPASGEVWRGPCRERARRGVPPAVSRGPGPV